MRKWRRVTAANKPLISGALIVARSTFTLSVRWKVWKGLKNGIMRIGAEELVVVKKWLRMSRGGGGWLIGRRRSGGEGGGVVVLECCESGSGIGSGTGKGDGVGGGGGEGG